MKSACYLRDRRNRRGGTKWSWFFCGGPKKKSGDFEL
jgi:hypothetical protein